MNRNYKFDNIKVLLIFLVVFGHLIEKNLSGESTSTIYFLIYTMHMPVFVFISGYFSNPQKFRYFQFFGIYLIYQIISLLLYSTIDSSPIVMGGSTIFNLIVYPRWTLWYPLSLIGMNLVLKFTENQKWTIYILLIFSLFYGLFDINWSFFSMGRTIGFLPYFYLGYRLRRLDFEQVIDRITTKYVIIYLPVILLTIYLLMFFVPANFLYFSRSYASLNIGLGVGIVVRVITYIIGIYWILFVFKLMPNKKMPLSKIGLNTLSIYLYHSIAIKLLVTLVDVKSIPVNIYLILSFILAAIAVVVLQYVPVIGYTKKRP